MASNGARSASPNRGESNNSESDFLSHIPCATCGSSDANSLYSDGHTFCFSCETYMGGSASSENTITDKKQTRKMNGYEFLIGEVQPLKTRGINADTCKKWDYKYSTFQGKPVQVATYRDQSGNITAQKLRFQDKDFKIIGDSKTMGLYGQHLWPEGGKMVVVTEGEIDALSVSQLQENKWPVVSVPNGAPAARKAIQRELEWLEKFERVIFMFDSDDSGKKAAKECAELLSVGKARIALLPMKDANELLVDRRGREVIDAIWGAKEHRPDGIVKGSELWDVISKVEDIESVAYPWTGLNNLTRGLRVGEIVTITAGSGIGKSQVCREISHYLLSTGQKVGYIALEESIRRTALGIISIELCKPLHLDINQVDPDELKQAFDNCLGTDKFFTYDHFGSLASTNLLNKVRYMAKAYECRYIVLDHLSIVVSGMGEGDERRLIDNTMTLLRSLVEELDICLLIVSHLKRPDGRGHEDGACTSLSQLRGSAAIAQLSDIVIGLERNQQDEEAKHISTVRVLKNRWTGETGIATHLVYDGETGRLQENQRISVENGGVKQDEEREEIAKEVDF